ncbi:MAG: ElyC/SanA/YdcF family protein [Syntrophomonadaceae bacterium]
MKNFLQNHGIQVAGLVGLLLVVLVAAFLAVNYYVAGVGARHMHSGQDVPKADAIIILGAYVQPDGTMSDMLKDRVTLGHELYLNGKAPRIIVSGDHGRHDYDEVNTMKDYLKNLGVGGQDIFMDHAGFSTYESLYRARDIFQAKKVIIVTQDYHLRRAVFIARELGLEAYGVASDRHDYGYMALNEVREMAARNKDFWLAKVLKPEPTFLGEATPVFGDGRATDDR